MPSKRKSKSTTANDGSWHEVECNGPDRGYGGCIAWTLVWLHRKSPFFFFRPFLCGFCAAEAIENLKLAVDDVVYSRRSCLGKDCLVRIEMVWFRNSFCLEIASDEVKGNGRSLGNFFLKGNFRYGFCTLVGLLIENCTLFSLPCHHYNLHFNFLHWLRGFLFFSLCKEGGMWSLIESKVL